MIRHVVLQQALQRVHIIANIPIRRVLQNDVAEY